MKEFIKRIFAAFLLAESRARPPERRLHRFLPQRGRRRSLARTEIVWGTGAVWIFFLILQPCGGMIGRLVSSIFNRIFVLLRLFSRYTKSTWSTLSRDPRKPSPVSMNFWWRYENWKWKRVWGRLWSHEVTCSICAEQKKGTWRLVERRNGLQVEDRGVRGYKEVMEALKEQSVYVYVHSRDQKAPTTGLFSSRIPDCVAVVNLFAFVQALSFFRSGRIHTEQCAVVSAQNPRSGSLRQSHSQLRLRVIVRPSGWHGCRTSLSSSLCLTVCVFFTSKGFTDAVYRERRTEFADIAYYYKQWVLSTF